jgi:hypothetical protein
MAAKRRTRRSGARIWVGARVLAGDGEEKKEEVEIGMRESRARIATRRG